MKKSIVLMAALFALSVPLAAVAAMEHGKMEGMEHGKMEGMEHGKMMMEGGMIMLGEGAEDGVKGMAHLKDVKESMHKMGMKETHHFMIMLMDEKTGEAIDTGDVALKIKTPSGNEGKPIRLMGMQGHFGADVTLAEKGEYHFKVGTKVKDGKKRQYEFKYEVK